MLVAAAIAAAFASAGPAHAATFNLLSGSTTLDQLLIAGNDATVGNLKFTFTPGSFFSTLIGSGFAPTANQITVAAFTSVPGEPGITFISTWSAGSGNGVLGIVDTKFQFTVTTLDGIGINDDYLATTGSATASSQWDVAESVTQGNGGATLANFQVNSPPTPGAATVVALATFPLQQSLTVNKDINLNATTGRAFISDVSQGFSSPVPLPAAAWAGFSMLGGLGFFGVVRRRRIG
jgi:hypothetical protein